VIGVSTIRCKAGRALLRLRIDGTINKELHAGADCMIAAVSLVHREFGSAWNYELKVFFVPRTYVPVSMIKLLCARAMVHDIVPHSIPRVILSLP
jgi:hypothetical protein